MPVWPWKKIYNFRPEGPFNNNLIIWQGDPFKKFMNIGLEIRRNYLKSPPFSAWRFKKIKTNL